VKLASIGAVLALALVACGGQPSPTAPATRPPAPTVVPTPPPAPTVVPTPPPTPALPTPTGARELRSADHDDAGGGRERGAGQPTAAPATSAAPTAAPTSAPPAAASPSPATKPAAASPSPATKPAAAPWAPTVQEYPVPRGSRPHDVAPATDGGVWYTAQGSGELGYLDPTTGATRHVRLGQGAAPHGVIVGPDGAPWITDGGLNAIVRVDPRTDEVRIFPLPPGRRANLNTAVFDQSGILWFTGQSGLLGRLEPASGKVETFDPPRGPGPYGITLGGDGAVYYASLAGSHVGRIDPETRRATAIDPPTKDQGARRVWADSRGRVWVSEYIAGKVGVYDPATGQWREWKLPGSAPQPYAIYVDERDQIWLSDFAANALVRFDPASERFESLPLPSPNGAVRQILGRPGEVWGAESGADKLIVVRTA
jgi:virginiamycin B lyase